MQIEVGISFDAAEKASGAIPEGDYELQVTGVTATESKAGNPMIKWEFTVINSSNPVFNNRKLFMNTPIPAPTGENASFIFRTCKALGKPWSGTSFNTDDYLGRSCKAKVVVEDYQGSPQNRISKLY